MVSSQLKTSSNCQKVFAVSRILSKLLLEMWVRNEHPHSYLKKSCAASSFELKSAVLSFKVFHSCLEQKEGYQEGLRWHIIIACFIFLLYLYGFSSFLSFSATFFSLCPIFHFLIFLSFRRVLPPPPSPPPHRTTSYSLRFSGQHSCASVSQSVHWTVKILCSGHATQLRQFPTTELTCPLEQHSLTQRVIIDFLFLSAYSVHISVNFLKS